MPDGVALLGVPAARVMFSVLPFWDGGFPGAPA
ncbi:hypothetical protein QFZ64_002406 [Streptomyces sp. B3I8]|nr:hypothetical protein [Streptomyces sp. B3I8]